MIFTEQGMSTYFAFLAGEGEEFLMFFFYSLSIWTITRNSENNKSVENEVKIKIGNCEAHYLMYFKMW